METKVCSRCTETLPLGNFDHLSRYAKPGALRPECKECRKAKARETYLADPEKFLVRTRKVKDRAVTAARRLVKEYLDNHPCVDCGEIDFVVLDFDHVRGKKVASVSSMVGRGASLNKIQKEIEKCEVRCSNCHRRKTAIQLGWYRNW